MFAVQVHAESQQFCRKSDCPCYNCIIIFYCHDSIIIITVQLAIKQTANKIHYLQKQTTKTLQGL